MHDATYDRAMRAVSNQAEALRRLADFARREALDAEHEAAAIEDAARAGRWSELDDVISPDDLAELTS